ncbi:hypothetical protein O3M35_013279 [Rhynocoris fuscipes]|uniref:CRAL-TRIO domain-containing protein n=1 Tax=Rhynocoris fuscipes TaxID=488301 RepID=A0AAW1CGN4_9HEMI
MGLSNENITLSEKDLEYCHRELNETEEIKKLSIKTLIEWLSDKQELNAKCDDFNLLRFLRGSKYDIEKAKRKITNFYKLRGTAPEWYENKDPFLPEIQELLRIGVFLPILERDDQGRLVIIIRIAAHNPYLHKQDDVFKVGLMTLDLLLSKTPHPSIYGVIAIFDMEGVSIGHARQLTVKMIKRAVHSWQDCYPVRVKGLHFINSPSYINVVLNIFRRFMREKLKNRIHVHGYDIPSLHNFTSKKILPEEYGGSGGKLQSLIQFWRNTVSENADWFTDDEKYKCVEPPINS